MLRWAGSGFVVGLGIWVDGLIISAIMASAVWLGGYFIVRCIRLRWQGTRKPEGGIFSALRQIAAAIVAIPAVIIGMSPALYWGATHNWANIVYLLNRSSETPPGTSIYLSWLYLSCAAPRTIGGALPVESTALTLLLHTLPLVLGAFCILASLALSILSFFRHQPLLLQTRRLVALPLIFGGFSALFFCIGNGSEQCTRDLLGRFSTPLALVLPFFIAAILTVVSSFEKSEFGNAEIEHPARDTRRIPRIRVLLFVLLFIVTPLSRTVSPLESAAFEQIFLPCQE